MRVLIDYRAALRERTGVGEYTHQLVRALLSGAPSAAGPALDVTVFSSSARDRLQASSDLAGARLVDRQVPVRLLNLAWHRLGWPPVELLAGGAFDVAHSLHPLLLPARTAAQVVTIHDLNFLLHPERTRAEVRRDYPALARDHAHRADRVIVVSQFTASEVRRLLGVPSERISVCSPGGPSWSARTTQPRDGYVLFFGTLEPRKNVGALLDAWELLAARRADLPQLVLAGKATEQSGPWLERLGRAPLRTLVTRRGYIAPADRESLYAGARLLVQPSFEEGFGLPVLEAMTAGVPVVAANAGALPEVGGDAALFADPNDPASFAAAIERFLDDDQLVDSCVTRGVARAASYNWANTARATLAAYEQAIARRTGHTGSGLMRIAIDARELSGKPTGVGRYLAGLLREWTRPDNRHGHEFLLYSHRSVENSAGCSVRELPGSGGTLWEQRTLPAALAADRVDVLFSPAYSTPLFTPVPRVVALHDISFAAHPEWFAWREGVRRRALARRSAAVSRRVVTISQFSKGEIVSRFGVDPAKIAVIPPGIDSPLAAPGHADPAHLHLPQGVHLLYVGSIFNRRHIPDLIAAFSEVGVRHGDAWLHLVGDNRSHPFEDVTALIEASPVALRIEWHQYAPDEALRELYRQARGFVFLSEYEGLGLTPLEALSAGIPSLLLDTAVARESCGNAACYVPLGSTGQIAAAIERLLYDEPTRQALAAAAPATLARYDWPTAARDTLALLESAR